MWNAKLEKLCVDYLENLTQILNKGPVVGSFLEGQVFSQRFFTQHQRTVFRSTGHPKQGLHSLNRPGAVTGLLRPFY